LLVNLSELYLANPEFGIDSDRLLRELDCARIVARHERNLRGKCMIRGVKRIEVTRVANRQRCLFVSCRVREDDTQEAVCQGITRIQRDGFAECCRRREAAGRRNYPEAVPEERWKWEQAVNSTVAGKISEDE